LKLALFVEIGEFSNEVKSFKHWQLTKIINWDKVKEEIVDCLHFFLSLANHFNVEIRSEKEKIAKKISSPEEYNEMILKLFNSTSRIPEVKQEEKDHSLCFTNWFKIFETICENVFSCEKELVDFYLTKNNTNRKRQQNGY
jgi:dimeric dUTPase (all-alpha-NTP-PPase superfamily)